MKKYLMSTALLLSVAGHAEARLSRSDIMAMIDDFRNGDAKNRSDNLPNLRQKFARSKNVRDRVLAALALGVNYQDKREFKSALQYFSIASQLTKQDDFLKPYIEFYLASLSYELGDYPKAVALSKNVLNQAPSPMRKREVLELLIEAYAKLKKFTDVIETQKLYEKAISSRTGSHATMKTVALAYAAINDKEKEIEQLESLSEQYPLSPEAIWGFNKLVDYNCVINGKRTYHFSQRLLQRMSINRTLDLGIEEFLASQAFLPIKDLRGQVRALQPLERVEFLLSLNLPQAARTHEDVVKDSTRSANLDEKRFATFLLARMQFEARDYISAAKSFNHFLSEYPKDPNAKRALDGLATSQFYLGAYGAASDIYERLVQDYKDPQYGWEHFWSTYLSANYNLSLELLDRPNYVKLKDPNEELARNYWRGRILEKLGRVNEADEEFRYILKEDATSYYANLVLSHKPAFWAEFVQPKDTTASLPPAPAGKPQILLASLDSVYLEQAPKTDRDLTLLQELVSAGLYREAIDKLDDTKFKGIRNQDDLLTMESLAYYLADFRSYRRIILEGSRGLRGFPKNLRELTEHQRTFGEQWKAVFPLAYDPILNRIEGLFKVDKLLILSLMRTESRFDVYARSGVGARGLMQIMPKTALKISELVDNAGFRVPELYEPSVNIGYGGFYFKRLVDYYQSNIFLAVAAYNAGPIATNRWLMACRTCETDEMVESISYRETRRYVKEVIKYFGIYAKVYKNAQPFWEIPKLPKKLDPESELF